MDGTNPLIFLGLGMLAKNPALIAIGLYGAVDPPDEEKKEENTGYMNVGESQENTGYLNVGESQENTGYSNVGEIQKTEKKRCIF